MSSCKNCGLEISENESDTHEGYCEKCYSERLEGMFPVYWAGTQWGSKPFGIPSPSTIRTEKLDPRKMVVAIGIMILMGVLVLAVYSALLDFANWVFQTQNVLLFLYEGSLLTLLGILLILWRIISRKEKHP